MFYVFTLLVLNISFQIYAQGVIADSTISYNFMAACDSPDTVILMHKIFRLWLSEYKEGLNCTLTLSTFSEVNFQFQWLELRTSTTCEDYLLVVDLLTKSSLKFCRSDDEGRQFTIPKSSQIKLEFVSSRHLKPSPTKNNGFFVIFTEPGARIDTTEVPSTTTSKTTNKSSGEFYIPLVLTLLVMLPACFCVIFSIIQRRREDRRAARASGTQPSRRSRSPSPSPGIQSSESTQVLTIPEIIVTPVQTSPQPPSRRSPRRRSSNYPPTYDSIFNLSALNGVNNAETQTETGREIAISTEVAAEVAVPFSASPPCYECSSQDSPNCSHN